VSLNKLHIKQVCCCIVGEHSWKDASLKTVTEVEGNTKIDLVESSLWWNGFHWLM